MKIHDQSKDEKPQYDTNREAAKKCALSSGKIKYEYFKGEEILPSNQKHIIEQAKFTFSSLWKTNKNNWRPRKKQFDALKNL